MVKQFGHKEKKKERKVAETIIPQSFPISVINTLEKCSANIFREKSAV